ncbi:putative FmdB family regulatory protein [Herbihabitans rhizosphaerae]|uniref:Putative FmdB family regulatory protein n=1 Tax=Herbihabitans rhizosphaerae TaxID=1872711 RepID=A0A4Q7KWE3_9PSEU|nr:FmdB family zinc ribbon protein [Herbihabitans rhizosphaerae]RZS40896.1 putative FmdB family regulatory protein [Herbihabitans rhizosphaerae]
MPTYQYACTVCDHRFEAVQKFTDSALTDCPECAGRLRKLYGSVGVVFKGSGFYRTDSRSGSSDSASASDSSSSSGTPKADSGSTKKSESKSESSGSSSSSTSSTSTNTAAAAS